MKIEIKNRHTLEVIFTHECENNTLKLTVEKAVELKANLSYADLSSANLSRANLSYADLSRANLSRANLSYANLSRANLSSANLSYADLSSANLSRANLSYADLSGADLSRANLSYADLSRANLSSANLSYADLSSADLTDANLSYADLSSADLTGANLTGTIGNMREICSMQADVYNITFTKDTLQIGCKNYTHQEWFNFHDETISDMDSNAFEFWIKWKSFIFQAIELKYGVKYD